MQLSTLTRLRFRIYVNEYIGIKLHTYKGNPRVVQREKRGPKYNYVSYARFECPSVGDDIIAAQQRRYHAGDTTASFAKCIFYDAD